MNAPSAGITRNISEGIERHLLRFEQTWGEPDAPSVEQLLGEVPELDRANLLRELLFIEFEFLQRKAAPPLIDQYLSRFPEYEDVIREVFQAVGQYTVFKSRNIAGYTLLEELGRGGMGIVYKAKNDLLNNVVAFKMVNQRVIDNPESLKRFVRELDMIGRLKHPNIVEAKHAGVTEDGTPYLVMEFAEGMTLTQWSKQNPPSSSGTAQAVESTFPWQRALTESAGVPANELKNPKSKEPSDSSRIATVCGIIHAAALGLQAIHEAGLVHRDIKPGNIMLLPDGQVKILDLGLAKLREHIAEHPSEYYSQTQQGQFLGTPGYAAPEQMRSTADVDIRADIYSLGCTFFYLLCGRSPSDYQANGLETSIPKKIGTILDKMLAADPAARYQEPREIVAALDECLRPPKKFSRLTGIAAAVVMILVAVAAAVAFWNGNSQETRNGSKYERKDDPDNRNGSSGTTLRRQFAEAIRSADTQPLWNFIVQFEQSMESEFLTREALDFRLLALEHLIDRVKETDLKALAKALRSLDRVLLDSYLDVRYSDTRLYADLCRYFDLAIRVCDPADHDQLVNYLLFRQGPGPSGRLPSLPPDTTFVAIYVSPHSEENGFALYYPAERQKSQRFELPFNSTAIKEAIRQGEELELCEPLVSQVRRDMESGVPIILAWDDEDWCFNKSFTIEEVMGQMK